MNKTNKKGVLYVLNKLNIIIISEVYNGFTEKIHVLHPPEPNVGRVLPDLLHLGELHNPVNVLVLGEAVPGPQSYVQEHC